MHRCLFPVLQLRLANLAQLRGAAILALQDLSQTAALVTGQGLASHMGIRGEQPMRVSFQTNLQHGHAGQHRRISAQYIQRRIRRTVLRESLSTRLISRRLSPWVCRVCTASRIWLGVMVKGPRKFRLQGIQGAAQACQRAQ